MQLDETYKHSISLANNPSIINDAIFKNLLENCFSVLCNGPEINNMNLLYHSKGDIVKEVYAGLCYICVEFARHGQTKDEVVEYLVKTLEFSQSRANLLGDLYEKHRQGLIVALLNIGKHLPHITDVNWKMEYIVKSNSLDQCDGPLFRVSFMVEHFDKSSERKKEENVNFTCTSQELQDLVYKLKDAARHCQRLTMDNN